MFVSFKLNQAHRCNQAHLLQDRSQGLIIIDATFLEPASGLLRAIRVVRRAPLDAQADPESGLLVGEAEVACMGDAGSVRTSRLGLGSVSAMGPTGRRRPQGLGLL